MLGLALSLLFISAAACQIVQGPLVTIPLSAPLPNGSMILQCDTSLLTEPCLDWNGCCSTNAILAIPISFLCPIDNKQIALCHFEGRSVDSDVQLLLTQNASAFLDSINRLDEQLRQQQAIYRALQIIGGHIGLPILLLFSIFSKTAQRDLTFLNFCFTWIFSSITFSVGLYRLGPASSIYGPALPFIRSKQECLNQAALVSGAQAMTDTAMCALIVQLWLDFRAAIHGPRSPRQIRWTRAKLLAVPYVALLAFSLPALGATTSIIRPGAYAASQMRFYCMLLEVNAVLVSEHAILLATLIVTLMFDAYIIHILYRRWRFVQRTGGNALGVPLSVAFRVVIFCVYRLVVAVAYVTTMLNAQGVHALTSGPDVFILPDQIGPLEFATSFVPVWVDMLQAGTPLVAFLIFGTSKEFLDALMFWKWFNPILATSMCRRRRSPVTPRESNACGEVVDHQGAVSDDRVLDIKQETKSTDACLPL
ncbi:hypothetical protein JB92DRAFT_3065686 [Gautieria morchelliformis]|nr:hypothetical protein JB92DRAFT_3065686 [Gautieria morchelliformis]